jgi:microcystin degradation protein MlrC
MMPRARLLEALRGVVGPDLPIVVTLDLHANATVRMARHANALISYRTYPHIDGYERAVQRRRCCSRRWTARRSRAASWCSRPCWKVPNTAAPPSPA